MSAGVEGSDERESEGAGVRLVVRGRADVMVFAAIVRKLIQDRGGTRRQAAEASIAAAEMVQNIVAHAAAVGDASAWFEGDRLFLRAADRGPGLVDPDLLLGGREARGAHGLGTGTGLGEGGAALVRLMDRVSVGPNEGGGLVVTACKQISARSRCVS